MNQHFRQLYQFQVVRVSRKRLRCLVSFFLRLWIRLVKFAVDTLELFLELRANGRAQYAKTPRVPGGKPRGIIQLILKSSDQRLCIHVCRLWETHQLQDSRSHVAEGTVLHTLYFVAGIDNNELNRIE